jgi:hypothetical protein
MIERLKTHSEDLPNPNIALLLEKDLECSNKGIREKNFN